MIHHIKLRHAVWTAMLVMSICSVTMRAVAQVKLSTLLPPGSFIQCGDKVFDLFTYSFTGDMPSADRINVRCKSTGPNKIGLQFQGGFIDFPGGGSSDAFLTYRVTSLGASIFGAQLSGNPNVVGGTGTMDVKETFAPDLPNSMTIFDHRPGTSKLSDSTFFPHVSSLHVQKDILGNGGTGFVTLSFTDQIYDQSPEGSSLCMMLLGATPLAAMMWRRGRSKS